MADGKQEARYPHIAISVIIAGRALIPDSNLLEKERVHSSKGHDWVLGQRFLSGCFHIKWKELTRRRLVGLPL